MRWAEAEAATATHDPAPAAAASASAAWDSRRAAETERRTISPWEISASSESNEDLEEFCRAGIGGTPALSSMPAGAASKSAFASSTGALRLSTLASIDATSTPLSLPTALTPTSSCVPSAHSPAPIHRFRSNDKQSCCRCGSITDTTLGSLSLEAPSRALLPTDAPPSAAVVSAYSSSCSRFARSASEELAAYSSSCSRFARSASEELMPPNGPEGALASRSSLKTPRAAACRSARLLIASTRTSRPDQHSRRNAICEKVTSVARS